MFRKSYLFSSGFLPPPDEGALKPLGKPVTVTFNVEDPHRPLRAAYFDFKALGGCFLLFYN